jgi:hypothetical protein
MILFILPKTLEDFILILLGLLVVYFVSGDGINLIYWGVLRLFGKKISFKEAETMLNNFLFGWLKRKK